MDMDADYNLYFFKIIFDGLTDDRLRIPPKFVKNIPKEISGDVILKGPFGDQWRVKLRKENNGIYLEDGWKKFMSDNSLRDYEFLVFGYNGNKIFNVKIYDRNGCERSAVPTVGENLKQGKQKKGTGTSAEMEAVQSFTSTFPYFEIRLTYTSAEMGNYLGIPQVFARRYLNKFSIETTIENSNGKNWTVTCSHNGNVNCLTRGWKRCARDNNLKIGDVCIFELMESDRMRINIFP